MLATTGIQAMKVYSSQARVGEFLSSKKNVSSSEPKLTGIDQVDISGRAKAISVAKSFTARLAQATQSAEGSANAMQTVASNVGTASHLMEMAQLKRKSERDEKFGKLTEGASLGFSKFSSEPLPLSTADTSQGKPKEAQAATKETANGSIGKPSFSINDFSLKFIRVLNPIPV